MSRKYAHRRPGGSWSKPVGLLRHMAVAADKVVAGDGPFVVTQDGDAISGELKRRDALKRYKQAVANREIGPVFRIRGKDGVVFTGRALIPVSDVDSTSGNTNCDRYWNWVKENFGAYNPRFAGAYVCKTVAGSSTLSQHSYGNAIDIFFDTLEQQDRVARATVQEADSLKPYHVISQQSIWTKGVGWTGYRGTTHYHLHVDFDPQYSGACGVKG